MRRKDGVRAAFELAYAGESSEKRAVTLIRAWARDVGIAIDVRIYDTDKLIDMAFNKDGERAAARLRHASCGRSAATRRPSSCSRCSRRRQIGIWNDSGFTNPRYEELYQQELQATDDAARVSAIHQLQRIATMELPYIQLYEADDISAVNTRTWSNWTTQPSPDGQPITSYGYDTIIALRPGELATPSYPGVPWALAGLGALAALGDRLVATSRAAASSASRSRSRTRTA